VQGSTGGSSTGGRGGVAEPPRPDPDADPDKAARDLARKMVGGMEPSAGLAAFATATVVAVATVIGTAIGQVLLKNNAVALTIVAVAAIYGLTVLGLYFRGALRDPLGRLRRARRRPGAEPAAREPAAAAGGPGTPAALDEARQADTRPGRGAHAGGARRRGPARRRRIRAVAVACALAIAGAAVGYFAIGAAFARGTGPGIVSVAGLFAVAGAAAAVLRWRWHAWPSWLRYRTRTALACAMVFLSLSAGATLGRARLVPPCPAPAELRVLASAEDLAGIQAAIPGFEQAEPARRHTACYLVDVTAYAAPSDSAAWSGLANGWGHAALSGDGPRPDIWIPGSSAEVALVARRAHGRVRSLGSVASSPLVAAVPDDLLAGGVSGLRSSISWRDLYTALSARDIGLALPNPVLSETGRLQIAALYPALTRIQQRAIEAPGSFPPDSGNLLCAAAQSTDDSAGAATRTAYLVSEAALIASNDQQLTGAACATLTGAEPPFTAFYPAGAAALDFPFTLVSWGAADPVRHGYELDFYRWLLTSTAARTELAGQGLRPPGCGKIGRAHGVLASVVSCAPADASAGAAVTRALASFQQAQAPAHILVGIDDSEPMQPYLPQITAAVDAELGIHGQHIGRRDSFGLWVLPGRAGQTYRQLVAFGPASARQPQVPLRLGILTGHAHSANYDMLASAAGLLYRQPAGRPAASNSVVLLTDGDAYPHDPHGHTSTSVTGQFDLPPAGHSRIKLFIIAFGPAGCTQAAAGSLTMAAFADATGGTCLQANGSDPRTLLAQVLGQISAGE